MQKISLIAILFLALSSTTAKAAEASKLILSSFSVENEFVPESQETANISATLNVATTDGLGGNSKNGKSFVMESLFTILNPDGVIVRTIANTTSIGNDQTTINISDIWDGKDYFGLEVQPGLYEVQGVFNYVRYDSLGNETVKSKPIETILAVGFTTVKANPLPPGAVGALVNAATGGVVEMTNPLSPIFGARIEIPAGALQADTVIFIAPPYKGIPDLFPFALAAGPSVLFGPEGIQFNTPAQITIPYWQSTLDAGNLSVNNLNVWDYDPDSQQHIKLTTVSIDTTARTITALLSLLRDPTAGVDLADAVISETSLDRTTLIADGSDSTLLHIKLRDFGGFNLGPGDSVVVEVRDSLGDIASTASLNWIGGPPPNPVGVWAYFDDGGTPGLYEDDQIIAVIRSNEVPGTATIRVISNSGTASEIELSNVPTIEFLYGWAPVGQLCTSGGLSSTNFASVKPSMTIDTNTDEVYVSWTESLSTKSGDFQGNVYLKKYDGTNWVPLPIVGQLFSPDSASGRGVSYELPIPLSSDSRARDSDVVVTETQDPIVAYTTSGNHVIVKRYDQITGTWTTLKTAGNNIRANTETGAFLLTTGAQNVSQAYDSVNSILYIAYHGPGAVSKLPQGTSEAVCEGDVPKLAIVAYSVRVRKFDFNNPGAGWQAVGLVKDICDEKYFWGDRDSDDDQGISAAFGPAGWPEIILDPYTNEPVVAYSQQTTYATAYGGTNGKINIVVKGLVAGYWETLGEFESGYKVTQNTPHQKSAPRITVKPLTDYYLSFVDKKPLNGPEFINGLRLTPTGLEPFPYSPENNVSGDQPITYINMSAIAIAGFFPAIAWSQKLTTGVNLPEIYFKVFNSVNLTWDEKPLGSASDGGISNTPNNISDGDTLEMLTDSSGRYWVARKEAAIDATNLDDEICVERF